MTPSRDELRLLEVRRKLAVLATSDHQFNVPLRHDALQKLEIALLERVTDERVTLTD